MKTFTQVKLILAEGAAIDRYTVELAHLAGFFSVNMQFPVVVPSPVDLDPAILYLWLGEAPPPRDNIIPVCPYKSGKDQWAQLFEQISSISCFRQNVPFPKSYQPTNEASLTPLHPAVNGGLELLFSPGWLLSDHDNDGIADTINCRLLLPDSADTAQLLAACDFAARLGMETAGIHYPLTSSDPVSHSHVIAFRTASSPAVVLEKCGEYNTVFVEGEGRSLIDFSARFCTSFPLAAHHQTLSDAARCLENAVCMNNYDGQAAALTLQKDPVQAFLSSDAPLELIRPLFPQHELHHCTDFQTIWQKRYTASWEVDEARTALSEILPYIHADSHVQLTGFLSECLEIRSELTGWFRTQALERGAAAVTADLWCAYKPGLSWLEESFAPRAAALSNVTRVEIFFNPHIRPGAPVNRQPGSPWEAVDNIVDKPPRWLQELYPVDELMASIIGLSPDDISFEAYLGTEDITYEARAYSHDGRCLLCDSLKVPVSEQFYLRQYPAQGICAPAAAHLQVSTDGQILLGRDLATDSQRLWDFYQSDVLPAVADFITAKDSKSEKPQLPLFARLELDVFISEPERTLPARNDILSSGEALSEDLCDAAKAFLSALCMERWNQRCDAVGHILPHIHLRAGPPEIQATLYDHLAATPRLIGEETFVLPDSRPVHASVTRVSGDAETLIPHFSLDCPAPLISRLPPLAVWMESGPSVLADLLSPYRGLVLQAADQALEVSLPAPSLPTKDLSPNDINWSLDRVLGYDDWVKLARQLMRVPGMDVYPAGHTFYGRTVYAVEPACTLPGYVSTVKRVLRNASLLIGGRHHANELSSSNAILQLMHALLTASEYSTLSEQLNVALLPMENADSAALHYELQKEHPEWAHHSCYTPPLGRDLYAMYFNSGALNVDGQAYSAIYRHILPDIFVDVHGVPSHDWPHQFFNAQGYKGLWLPRALICAFYWYCSDPDYAENLRLNRAWAESVSQAYFSRPDLQAKNAEWNQRFTKYSYNGINLDFPCGHENKMLNYWIPCAHHPGHPYLSARFPWITSVSFTSEATDEGAFGTCLRDCIDAQYLHIRAGIELCLNAGKLYRTSVSQTAGGLAARLLRLRPLLPPQNRIASL